MSTEKLNLTLLNSFNWVFEFKLYSRSFLCELWTHKNSEQEQALDLSSFLCVCFCLFKSANYRKHSILSLFAYPGLTVLNEEASQPLMSVTLTDILYARKDGAGCFGYFLWACYQLPLGKLPQEVRWTIKWDFKYIWSQCLVLQQTESKETRRWSEW